MKYMDVADTVCDVISKSELSIMEISRKSGVPHPTILGWLNKSRTPTMRNASYVLTVLGYELRVMPKND